MERRLVSPGRLLLGDRLQSLTCPRPSDQWSGLALGDPHGNAFGIAPNDPEPATVYALTDRAKGLSPLWIVVAEMLNHW